MGFGCMHVCNIFALRSTDPRGLRRVDDPIGPGNDQAIMDVATKANMVVCGWGNHGLLHGRGAAILDMLARADVLVHALRMTKQNQPSHPLYIGYKHRPFVINQKARDALANA